MPLWLAGLLFSVLIGSAWVPTIQRWAEWRLRLHDREEPVLPVHRISPDLTGTFERILCSSLVAAYGVSAILTPMIAWIGTKMLANWNSPEARALIASDREIITRRFLALLMGTLSLTIATIGGLIWRGDIPAGQFTLWTTVDALIIGAVIRFVR